MQENEFEKQLKNMMEDFNLSPSDTVWEKVKQRLNKKDRRRIPFFFLLGIGLITGGFFIYRTTEQKQDLINTANNKTVTQNKTGNNAVKDSTGLFTQMITAKKDEHSSSANNKINRLKHNKNLYNIKTSLEKNTLYNSLVDENYQKQKNNSVKAQPVNTNNFKQLYYTQITNNTRPVFLNNKLLIKDSIFIKQPVSNNDSAKTIVQKNIEDSTNKNLIATNSIAASQKNMDTILRSSSTKKINNNYKTTTWQWGITASWGKSDLVKSLVNADKSLTQYTISNPGTGYDTSFHNAHPFLSANAYSAGTIVKKKIFKNAFLSAGLNFIHLSATSDIGETIDSAITISNAPLNYSVSRYAQPGSLKTYTSAYNFIELPFTFQQYFFHSNQTALSYNAGFSIRQLISSNALIYDPARNIYFSKDKLLHKTQFQFTAGLHFEINTGKTNSVFIGPQFTYSLSNFIKNTSSSSFHFINYGVQAGFLLHKK